MHPATMITVRGELLVDGSEALVAPVLALLKRRDAALLAAVSEVRSERDLLDDDAERVPMTPRATCVDEAYARTGTGLGRDMGRTAYVRVLAPPHLAGGWVRLDARGRLRFAPTPAVAPAPARCN